MSQMIDNQVKASTPNARVSLADELRAESDRLRQLAEAMQAREEALAAREAALGKREAELEQMLRDYPEFKKLAHQYMGELMGRDAPPWPEDGDLAKWAKEQGGRPLEDFIDELFPRGGAS